MKMQLQNAIKKLNKAGFEVTQQKTNGAFFDAVKAGCNYAIQFIAQNNSIVTINVKHHNDKPDVMTDYFPGIWCDTITQAVKLATR
jgi:hypothetical protein